MGYDHQVEMKLAAEDVVGRLQQIESWCADWEISFRVLDRFPGSETIRIAFEDQRLARAFIGHFGGVLVDDCELEQAMARDVADGDAYERLAREYPD